MALIEKETLLKGLWDVVLIGVSGTVCVAGSYFVVTRAVAKATAQTGTPASSTEAPINPVNLADPHQPPLRAWAREVKAVEKPPAKGLANRKKKAKKKRRKRKGARAKKQKPVV
ncbi:MAG: hypothetical protein IPN19_13590 [Elusimicrobia bacterium]|nr:hypothetical protein [Elusimicrobiota bacterium]